MKSSSIAESVYEVNLNYARLQNKAKELFFKCLYEGRDDAYFEKELRKLWGDNDINYLEQQIIEYREALHFDNTGEKMTEKEKKNINVAGMVALAGAILVTNELFKKSKVKEYKLRYESYGYKTNKEEYLEKLVPKYTNYIKPYYEAGKPKTVENIVRFVSPNTYNAMAYNTAVTRNGWYQTLNDGGMMGIKYYYIPTHSFSCPYCMQYQEQKMTEKECYNLLGTADIGRDELLHPNCKCELTFYEKGTKFKKLDYEEGKRQYHVREKVMSLELKKEELQSDKAIYKRLYSNGYDTQKDIDKVNNQIKKINSSIKELTSTLPTTSLKKQAVAR